MYRQWQTYLEQFELVAPTNRHLLTMDEETFPFLWYVYNRGGFCNVTTLVLWFSGTERANFYRVNRLVTSGWLTLLKTVRQKDRWMGRKPKVYRVSSRFLRCVGNPNANIRKVKLARSALAAVAHANFFLQEANRDYQIVNRTERRAYLSERFDIDPDDLPKYFLDSNKDHVVISLNHELALRDENIFVVYYPTDGYGGDFKEFVTKWTRIFELSDRINCLAISVNRPTHKLFRGLVTRQEQARPQSAWEQYQQADAEARGEATEATPEEGTIPFKLITVHFPDIWDAYLHKTGVSERSS